MFQTILFENIDFRTEEFVVDTIGISFDAQKELPKYTCYSIVLDICPSYSILQ